MSHAIVVYCPRCDYFLKTGVQEIGGSHGCLQCGGLMEGYVPQELAAPMHTHQPPQGRE